MGWIQMLVVKICQSSMFKEEKKEKKQNNQRKGKYIAAKPTNVAWTFFNCYVIKVHSRRVFIDLKCTPIDFNACASWRLCFQMILFIVNLDLDKSDCKTLDRMKVVLNVNQPKCFGSIANGNYHIPYNNKIKVQACFVFIL